MLHMGSALRERLAELTVAEYPREACGLLVGRGDGRAVRVERVLGLRNLDVERARDRFVLDPDGHARVQDAARREGLDVVGVWHSHPDHPARPSETDREAAWEGWSYLIASVSALGVQELRSWRLCDGRFEEEDIVDGRA
jgi:proteasome lid subunit RPN8/RPN11